MAEPIDVPFAWDVALGGPVEEPCVIWGPDPPGEQAVWGTVSLGLCEQQEISDVTQRYLLGGGSDAAFCCQCCSNLFVYLSYTPGLVGLLTACSDSSRFGVHTVLAAMFHHTGLRCFEL